MLKGIDISAWQTGGKVNYSGCDFVIIRATKGGAKDSEMLAHYNKALKENKLIGFYHYAYPDLGNTAKAEADNFVETVKPYLGKTILALDFEQNALTIANPDKWALDFLNEVYKQTGIRPMLYVQASAVHKFKMVQANNYGLWIAHWGADKPTINPWKFYALWQYRGEPLDLDFFNGDKEAWLKYANCMPPTNNETTAVYYTVKSGDTLWDIAQKYNTTYQDIANLNNLTNVNLIYPNQKLRVK